MAASLPCCWVAGQVSAQDHPIRVEQLRQLLVGEPGRQVCHEDVAFDLLGSHRFALVYSAATALMVLGSVTPVNWQRFREDRVPTSALCSSSQRSAAAAPSLCMLDRNDQSGECISPACMA